MKKHTIYSTLALISVASSASAATLQLTSPASLGDHFTGSNMSDADAGTVSLSLTVNGTFAGGAGDRDPEGTLLVTGLAPDQNVVAVSGSISIREFEDGINFKIDDTDVLVFNLASYSAVGSLSTTALRADSRWWGPWTEGRTPTIEFDSTGTLKLMVTAEFTDTTALANGAAAVTTITAGDRFNLLDYATGYTTDTTALTTTMADGSFDFSVANTNVGSNQELRDVEATINVEIVPEPSSTALLGLGFFGLLIKRRR